MAGTEPVLEAAHAEFDAAWAAELALGLDPDEVNGKAEMGRELVRLFVELDLEVPDDVEGRFEVPLTNPRTGEVLYVPLLGFVDFTVGDVVGEVKTTGRKSAPSTWGLQLAAYSYAHRLLHGVRPAMRLVQLIKTKTPRAVVTDVRVAEDEERWFLEVAAEALSAIQAGACFPNPGWACGGCEFRGACRHQSST